MASNHKHDDPLPDTVLRVKSLESLLIEKGLVEAEALDALIDRYENKVGPKNGAKVVARAWMDVAYRERLLADATSAVAEFGFTGAQGEELVAVENTDKIHNVVVCTLCSCYPWPVLGLPPVWYKSAPYRARVVREPRKVLEEFGTHLAPGTEVRVWDSTAETRYLVIPKRPAGTERMDEEALARLVNRDSMIGTREADRPSMTEGA
ncbi:nitrile hydratase subunit alpha [uncultured Sneathiella sp.]|uniref:nitrile hydratase subunit alpha n=1 Tax=uncultured Sneathiella sp. TaxID=879315 RepID=UPI0025952617|nr:nitrile hydratase subunit alpha [uncultured Sneathiella sp.]